MLTGTGSISSGSAKSVHSSSIGSREIRTDSRLEDSINDSTGSTLSTSYPGY